LLALALGAQVPLLLLDEPTANLDARARRDFLRALNQASDDTSILLATHRLTDVESVADRLLVLHNGRIAFDGKMDELWRAVGAEVMLWIRVPQKQRNHACSLLQDQWQTSTLRANGSALGIQVDRGSRPGVFMALHQNGILVEDFWTETPSLNDLMERLIGS
jgi:ABC-type multidrug transport system ATPase subunit